MKNATTNNADLQAYVAMHLVRGLEANEYKPFLRNSESDLVKRAKSLLLLIVWAGVLVPAAYAESQQQTLSFPMQGYEGNFREHCMELAAGKTLSWTLYSPFAVQMNIHHHVGNRTQFLFDSLVEDAASASVELPAAGEYCFEIVNPETRREGFEVTLEVAASSD